MLFIFRFIQFTLFIGICAFPCEVQDSLLQLSALKFVVIYLFVKHFPKVLGGHNSFRSAILQYDFKENFTFSLFHCFLLKVH